jgi:lipopolysaccharide export system permease protein
VVEFLVGASAVPGSDPVPDPQASGATVQHTERQGMIYSRYLAWQIYKGAMLVLLVLVSISVFFTFTQQVDHLGKGDFGGVAFTQYLMLRVPATLVEFVPLAALLGTILSLGQLASNSELIALNAAGVSMRQLAVSVVKASLLLALLAGLVSEYVAPLSESSATRLKTSSIQSNISLQAKTGIWIRDDRNIIYIGNLFPNGDASQVQVFQLGDGDKMIMHSSASTALPDANGWLLRDVRRTRFDESGIVAERIASVYYEGSLENKLFESLVVDPEQMSMRSLNAYVDYLRANGLSYQTESLFLWKKIYSPLSVIVLGLMALPFVTGSQRQGNTGQRLMIGILLGLAFAVLNSILIQIGEQLRVWPPLNALVPNLLFLFLTIFLIRLKSVRN